jgi:branched-chain amino acid transport system permease protein
LSTVGASAARPAARIDSRVWTLVWFSGAVVALLFFTQVILRTPPAILYRGAAVGMVNALTAAGIILVYRTLRVINFAQGAIGAAGAILTFSFVQYTEVPFLIGFLLGLLLSGLIGFAVGVLALRFFKAPRLVLTVFTIAIAFFIAPLAPYAQRLPFFPRVETLSAFESLGSGNFANRLPLAGLRYQIGDLPFPLGFNEIMALEVGLLALLGVAAFFRYTRGGTAVRAIAENSERASLLGIGVGGLSIIVWIIAGVLSGAGATLTGILINPQVVGGAAATAVLLPALAAAVLGRMRSLPITAAAAVGISILTQAWDWKLRNDRPALDAVIFLLIAIGLLVQRRRLLRSEQQAETSSWVASQEPRPIPRELLAVGGIRITRWVLTIIGLVVAAIYPFAVGTGATVLGGVIAINAIVVISLVVLTGWAGQVSLGQYGFVAVGAVLAGAMSADVGLPFWLVVPLATAVVAAFASLVGLPALRIPGLFLLPVTFAFAAAIRSVLFNERYFGWLLPETVQRPSILFIDFEDERAMYYLSVAALVVAILAVVRLRRTRVGRLLIGLRDNEPNVRAFGVSAVRTKLLAFTIAGALAGFAGAIFAYQQRGAAGDSFLAERSVNVFIEAVFGGIGSISGALLGSAYFAIQQYVVGSPVIQIALGPTTVLALLYAAPGGLISLLLKARDGVLKIVAQRRQIFVPSLFSDVDPEMLRGRLWPLAESEPQGGLAALPFDRRYRLRSWIYGQEWATNGAGKQAREEEGVTAAVAAALEREGEQGSVGTGQESEEMVER